MHSRTHGLTTREDIQIVALTRALSISTSIAYLDQSPSFSGGAGQGIVDFHHFEEESEEKLVATLLYRACTLQRARDALTAEQARVTMIFCTADSTLVLQRPSL